MENSYEPHSNGYVYDSGLHIARHIPYQSSGRSLLPWFDIRVFYARISKFLVDDSTPECLTLNHISLSPETVLEVNGVRRSADSEVSCILRRDRMDKKSEEATFISTDSIRLTGSVKFEILDREELVISGFLEMSNTNGFVGEVGQPRKWNMVCESAIVAGSGFLKGKQIDANGSLLPTIEVYVAGCCSGTPIILTKTLKLKHPKKLRKSVLNSIPEHDNSESHEEVGPEHGLQVVEYKSESDEDYDNLYWRRTEYVEGEDGELSWFNAGVRVGVGIGLGVCLGIGIGIGLLVRTYQTTTRTFRRQLG